MVYLLPVHCPVCSIRALCCGVVLHACTVPCVVWTQLLGWVLGRARDQRQELVVTCMGTCMGRIERLEVLAFARGSCEALHPSMPGSAV